MTKIWSIDRDKWRKYFFLWCLSNRKKGKIILNFIIFLILNIFLVISQGYLKCKQKHFFLLVKVRTDWFWKSSTVLWFCVYVLRTEMAILYFYIFVYSARNRNKTYYIPNKICKFFWKFRKIHSFNYAKVLKIKFSLVTEKKKLWSAA